MSLLYPLTTRLVEQVRDILKRVPEPERAELARVIGELLEATRAETTAV